VGNYPFRQVGSPHRIAGQVEDNGIIDNNLVYGHAQPPIVNVWPPAALSTYVAGIACTVT